MEEDEIQKMNSMLHWLLNKYPGCKYSPAILIASTMTGDQVEDLRIRNKQIYNKNKGIPSLEVHKEDSEKGGWRSYPLSIRIPLFKKDMTEDVLALIECIKEDQISNLHKYIEKQINFINKI